MLLIVLDVHSGPVAGGLEQAKNHFRNHGDPLPCYAL